MSKAVEVDYGDRIEWFDESLDDYAEGVVVKGVYDVQPFATVKRLDNDEYDTVDLRYTRRL